MQKLRPSASYISEASPAAIFPLLKNSATWPLWSMIDKCELVRTAEGELHGVGSQRRFYTGRLTMFEEIVELLPNERVSYVLHSGFPLKEYRAETILEPLAGSRTRITWRSSFYPKYWGTGWFWWLVMYRVYRDLARALAQVAENPERAREILALSQGNQTSKHMIGTLQQEKADA